MQRSIQEILHDISSIQIGDGNEATTRLKIIDEILFGVLGWLKDDVDVEEHVSEDGKSVFLDYLCKTAQTSILIEAKRIGVEFKGLPDSRRSSLKSSWIKGEVGDAIRQARDYGRKKGAGFCVTTNGDAWIVFPINRRDLVSFEDSSCIIFPNAQSVLNRDIDEFVALLSRESVIDGSLDTALLGGERDQFEPRRLNQIFDKSFSKSNRSSVFSHIEQEIVTAFSEELIIDNPDLLEKSYVTTPDRTRFDDRIKMYLLRREQVFNSRPLRPIGRDDISTISSRLQSTKVTSRPIAILTLGLVGSGKTTFLNYVAKVSAADYFTFDKSKPSAHWVYVDFRDYSPATSPRSYVVDHLFNYISENEFLSDFERCLKHAYQTEIDNLRKGLTCHWVFPPAGVRVRPLLEADQ